VNDISNHSKPWSPSAPPKAGKPLDQGGDPPSLRSQVGPILFLTSIFFLNFLARVIMAPLMPSIEKDLGLSHGGAGSFFFLISVGYFIALTGAGFISSRFTHRKTIVVSAITCGCAILAIALSANLLGISAGLLFLGVASGIYLPSGIAMITSVVSSKHWGKALAIHELAPNLGLIGAPLISEALLSWMTWREVLILLAVICLVAGLAFWRFGRGGKFPGKDPSFGALKILLGERSIWIMIALFSIGVSATMGIYAMLPLYLIVERGMEQRRANTFIALSRVPGIGMSFLAGWATDRFGSRHTLACILLLTGLFTILLGCTVGPWLILIIFLQPMLAGSFFPAGFAALALASPRSVRDTAVSFTIPFAFLVGGGAVPIWIGIMGDAGVFSIGITAVGGMVLTGFFLAFYLKFPDGRKDESAL